VPETSLVLALEQFTTFGDLLKYLRRRAGLTQRDLSIAVGYSISQISRLEQNQRLPDLATLSARFLPVLDLDEAPAAGRRLMELAAAIRLEDAPAPGPPPFKGLPYFDESDAEQFFGREALVETLAARLISQPEPALRFLGVVGASGSGKSSLMRAGLIPAVRRQAGWSVVVFTPTAHPLEAPLPLHIPGWVDSRGEGESGSAGNSSPPLPGTPAPLPLLLVVDQFEELFALCRSEAEQASFVDQLLAAAGEPGGAAHVVIALRADFYGHCARFAALREALAQHQEYIGPMTAAELRRAIEEPARRGQWEFEPGLVDVLLKDVGADGAHPPEPGALPLLSHALLQTWQRRRGQRLTLSGYAASGGVRGAIAETAESVFQDQLDPAQRAIARQIFLRLTEPGDDGVMADTRRRASLSELIPTSGDEAAVREVLNSLADARLITTRQEGAEVAHEALIREWPTLRGWLEEDRDGLRLHRGLTEAAQEWMKLEREAGALYRGARLAQALEWSAGHPGQPNALEQEFLEASRSQAEREAAEREAARQRELEAARRLAEAQQQRAETQARSASQLRRRAIYLSGALVVAVVAALAAGLLGRQASQSATLANQNLGTAQAAQATALAEQGVAQANFTRAESQRLAAESLNLANTGGSSELAALLALRAVKLQYSPQADAALQAAASLIYPLRVLVPGPQNPGEIFYIDYSPDGRFVATISNPAPPIPGAVTVWDVQTGKALHTFQWPGFAQAAFSPDSQSLLVGWMGESATDSGPLEVYNVTTGQRTRQIQLGPFLRPNVFFWLDDHTVIMEKDGIIRLDLTTGQQTGAWSVNASWIGGPQQGRYAIDDAGDVFDLATAPTIVATISAGLTGVVAGAISHDAAYAAFGFGDGSIQLWTTSPAHMIAILHRHIGAVTALDFSPDDQFLLSGGADKTARLWLTANGQQVRLWNTNASEVDAIRFSGDGRSFAAGSLDGTARLWSIAAQPEWPVLAGHKGIINGVAFSPDGKQLATAGVDGLVHLWDVHTSQIVETFSSDGVVEHGLRFTRDGRQLLLADGDTGEMDLWNIAMKTRAWLTGPDTNASYHDVAFSPDGQTFTVGATWCCDPGNYAAVFDTHTGKPIWRTAIPDGHGTDGFAVDYSSDGRLIVLATDADNVWLLDAHSGRILRQIQAHDLIWGVRIAPDSLTIVTAGQDKTARLWDVTTGQEIRQFAGHTDLIWRVAFSPDGKQIATASHDGTIGVWDVATGQLLRRFVSDTLGNEDVAWSPDGKLLASVGDSGVARLWDADYHTTINYLCGQLQRDLSDAERAQYNITDVNPTCGR